jgi:DNA repair exonuclease SbcCD ATPase subunit
MMIKIKNILTELNTNIPDADVQRNIDWKLKKFEFENMFSYGENNVVDFTKLNGIIGMFAPNATGKSALLDSLCFCLFDTSSRAYKADNIINNSKTTMYCKVNFEIDGIDYFIEKRGKKNLRTGHVKVNVDFYLIDDSGERVSLNGDQRRTTQKNIQKVIGSFDEFILTTMSSQNNSTVFIDKTQKERKELLSQFMGLTIFDRLYTQAAEDIKEVDTLLKNFKKADYDTELASITQELSLLEDKHKQFKSDERKVKKEIREVLSKIKEQTVRLKPIDTNVRDITLLTEEKKKLDDLLYKVDEQTANTKTQVKAFALKQKDLNTRISQYEKDNVNEKYAKLEQLEEERDLFQIEIDKLKVEVRQKLDKIEKLGNLTYDEDCDNCMSNPFTLDAIETQKNLDKDKLLAQQYVSKKQKMEDRIQKMFKVRAYKGDLDSLMEQLSSLNLEETHTSTQLNLLEEKRTNIFNQLNSVNSEIQKYHNHEKDILFNSQIESEIDNLQNQSDNLDYQLDTVSNKVKKLYADIKVLKTNEENINSNIKKVAKLEGDHQAYQYLLEAIRRDGVPYDLISKSLPTVEGAVNDILSQIVDFSIIFNMDGKVIDTHIVYDDDRVWPLELSSGMERFISSLAIRVGLINVSNLPRSNFLAIDEGWGTMDSENINSVYSLFQYLKTQFQFTMIVSHIDSMRDAVDTLLEVKKTSSHSNIIFD